MGLKFQTVNFSELKMHRDMRFGLSITSFKDVISTFKSNDKYPLVRLNKVLSLEYGDALVEQDRNENGKYPVMGSNGIVGYHDEYLIEGPAIIVGRKGSAGEVTYVEENNFPIDTAFYVKIKDDTYRLKFLYYLLRVAKLSRLALNKGVPGLNRYDAYEVLIPLVPKEVQDKLLSFVEPLEKDLIELEANLKQPIDVINEVFIERFKWDVKRFTELKAVKVISPSLTTFSKNIDLRFSYKFHNEAGEYVTNVLKSQSTKKIKDFLAEDITLGKSISPSDYDEEGEQYYISMADIKKWWFDVAEAKTVSTAYYEANSKKQVMTDDIILARSGEGTIGKVAIITNDEVEAVYADFTMRIRLKGYDPAFAYYYFRTDFFQYLIYTHKKGLGNNTNIFPSQIQEFPVPDISIQAQKQIVELIKKKLDAQKQIQKQIDDKQSEIAALIENAIKHNK